MKKRKAVFNWSGGKDSALALYKILKSGKYEIVSLLTTVRKSDGRSSMHGIPTTLLNAQARSIGIPLRVIHLPDNCDMEEYGESFRETIEEFKAEGVTDFIFGDIFLQDVRCYRESQLAPYSIEVVEPLWGLITTRVINEFLSSGLQTIIVTTDASRLGRDYIGKKLDRTLIDGFPPDVDPCGENGEYHTFCYDGPIFDHPVEYNTGDVFSYSHELTLDDGSVKEYFYWGVELK